MVATANRLRSVMPVVDRRGDAVVAEPLAGIYLAGQLDVANCSCSEFLYSGEWSTLSAFNAHPHLNDAALLTYR